MKEKILRVGWECKFYDFKTESWKVGILMNQENAIYYIEHVDKTNNVTRHRLTGNYVSAFDGMRNIFDNNKV